MREGRPNARQPALLLLAIVAFSSIVTNWRPIHTVPAIDFYQFWVVGQELEAGRAGDIYSAAERERIGEHHLDRARENGGKTEVRAARQRETLETFSTPFMYTVFGAVSSGDYDRDLRRYRDLALAALLFAVVILCRLLGYGALSTIAAMAVFAAWFAPTRSDWLVGNVNSFQLALLACFVWLACRFPSTAGHVVGGLVLGASAMWKPNSALVVVLLLLAWAARRRYAKLVHVSIGIAVAAIAAFIWSSIAFRGGGGGVDIWWSWLSALSALPEDIITVELGNYAPSRLLLEWIGIDAALAIGLACLGLTLVALIIAFSGAPKGERPEQAGFEDLGIVALGSLITLLGSPLAWLHYFVAAIPMLLVALGPAWSPRGGGLALFASRVLAWIALVAVMMRPLVILGVGDDRSRAAFLCLGTVILFGLGLWSLLSFRSDHSAGEAGSR